MDLSKAPRGLPGNPRAAQAAPWLSAVVALLDDAGLIRRTLDALEAALPGAEVLVVDGGSRDGSLREVETWQAARPARRTLRLVRAPSPGRGAQMNLGAAEARGPALLFLHADTLLPCGAGRWIREALAREDVVGGAFRHGFQERSPALALVSAGANLRSRWRRTFYGDQALFVRRSVFEAAGGFPPQPLFEDWELSRRIRRRGRVVLLPGRVRTSGRRFLRRGVARTVVAMTWLKLQRALGRDLEAAAARYWRAPARGLRPGAAD